MINKQYKLNDFTDTQILNWLDENTRGYGDPIEGWMQDMGYGHFQTIREWAINEMNEAGANYD